MRLCDLNVDEIKLTNPSMSQSRSVPKYRSIAKKKIVAIPVHLSVTTLFDRKLQTTFLFFFFFLLNGNTTRMKVVNPLNSVQA